MLTVFEVDELARKFDGKCRWDFQQCFSYFGIRARAGDGICVSLSAEWIRRFLEGSSLANHLGGFMNGRAWTPPNLDELNRLSVYQEFLFNKGARWKTALLSDMRNKYWIKHYKTRANLRHYLGIKTELQQLNRACGLVTILSSNPRNDSSHAVAVYVGQHDESAVIFDPNYGEYWFDNQIKFFYFVSDLIRLQYSEFDVIQVDKFSKGTISTKLRAMLSHVPGL